MTFLVNHSEPQPTHSIIAGRMTLVDPDHTWKKVDTGR
jgi:hypothetical protein